MIRKLGFKLFLQIIVFRKGVTLFCFSGGIKINQLISDVLDPGGYACFGFGPLGSAQSIDVRNLAFASYVFLNQIQLRDRDKDLRVIAIVDHHIVLIGSINCHRLNAGKDPDPMVDMDDIVTGL